MTGIPAEIVVGVDGSPSSLDALRWAVGQAGLTGATVRAVLAWEYPAFSGVDPLTEHVDWRANALQTLDAALEAALGTDSTTVSRSVVQGHPAKALLEASAGADMLVVGNRGHTELLLGSVASQLLNHAACPVLVMPHGSPGHPGGPA